MRAKLECHYSFKDLLAKRGLKDLEIGWVLAHLSIYNFDLDQTRYVGKVLHADSEGKSKWLWLKNQLNIEAKKIGASKTFTEAIQDCIDWEKKTLDSLREKYWINLYQASRTFRRGQSLSFPLRAK